jgi:uncharacterized protein (DUF362 family)
MEKNVMDDNYSNNLGRRSFMKILPVIGMTGFFNFPPKKKIRTRSNQLKLPTTKNRLVIVKNNKATQKHSIDKDAVREMVDAGIRALTHKNNIGEAWKSLFPNITAKNVIAIKVNCRYFSMPTHHEVTYAVVGGLKKMVAEGVNFPENNIIIFDNFKAQLEKCGYTINTSKDGVRCFNSDDTVGYSKETFNVNGISQRLSKVVTDLADYIINISVLKNHDSVAGATICLKNHFGSCDNPRAMHRNNGDPYIAALNALSPIKEKQCVNICDALFGIRSGGPGGYPQFTANKIIMSRDIVAVDYWGRKILEENNAKSISRASHIDTAATAYKLGTNDPSQMDIVDLIH